MHDEWHITSLVVHSTPQRMAWVSESIASIPGAIVHAASPSGKLVVTLEASTADEIMSKVIGIQRADGVLSAALVYQCADRLATMNEEIPDADH
jgi:nitrate reductase NapD